jgi:hypothetical protein
LAAIELRYRDPPGKATAPAVEALRGGFCVLIVGSFERFLTEAFQEHLGALEGEPPPIPFSALPDALRINSVFESLGVAMKGPRYGAPPKRSGRFGGVAVAARRVVDENIDSAALAQTKGNPKTERVEEMFKAIGVKKPFVDARPTFDAIWMKPESSTFVEDKLDEIVNARHVVAHTAEALQIGRADLQVWPSFLEALATGLDERLDIYVGNVLNRTRPV